jgi:hypothetical protein
MLIKIVTCKCEFRGVCGFCFTKSYDKMGGKTKENFGNLGVHGSVILMNLKE